VNIFYQPRIPEGIFYLDEEESRHCAKVLRKIQGENIRITDGKGFFYDALITNPDSRQCSFKILHQIEEAANNFSIHIAISPTKNADRIEWFVEKSIELGVDQITLMACSNTERNHLKTERLQKVAISAMKQSLKARLPVINSLTSFETLLSSSAERSKFIAYVDQANPDHLKNVAPRDSEYLVLIGPEGDFSKEELDQAIHSGFHKVSLGNSRLRTETAGIAACHILNLINS
jgi:16S rRNA (uracil1498-N3)-methyltransferase